MAKYKITHDRENCIGCGACVTACPGSWEMKDDHKSSLKGSVGKDGKYELETDDAGCNKSAAETCPVGIISVEEVKE